MFRSWEFPGMPEVLPPAAGSASRPDHRTAGSHPSLRDQGHRPWPIPERPWIGRQVWNDLAFLHWPVPAALLRLFAAKRPIWLLDEPSVSLDAASVQALSGSVQRHLAEGGVAVVASHTKLALKFAQELKLGRERAA